MAGSKHTHDSHSLEIIKKKKQNPQNPKYKICQLIVAI